VIESFADAETEKVFRGEVSRKLPPDIQRTARRKLLYLHSARDLRDLAAPPGNRLEKLSGHRAGQHSLRINDQWRICFVWAASPGKARKVEIVDYHK
jgi:proteic killer suppression protein